MSKLFNTHPLVVDKQLATILGLNEALVLQQVNYWLEINKKKKRNYHEGRYWTYNTINKWQDEFPFWSISTIKRIFKRLRDMELIIVDNFNLYQMDRTLWYTINYDELERLVNDNLSNFREELSQDTEIQNNTTIGSKGQGHYIKDEPMEKSSMTSPIPEISSKISSDIYSQSINQSKDNIDGLNTQSNEFKIDYEKIIENCELYAIDEKYREAVAHAIKLLILDIQKSKQIKIGDIYVPVKIVEEDLKRLNYLIIEHAVNRFKEISKETKIRNPISYLKVCIYNSINEIKIDLDSKLRYDGVID